MLHLEGIVTITRNPEMTWIHLSLKQREKILEYKGFDSIIWFWAEDNTEINKLKNELELISIEDFEQIKEYIDSTITTYTVFITNSKKFELKNKSFKFIGFDVGVTHEYNEPVFFSGIFNEVRDGGNEIINSSNLELNKYYLFNSIEDCENYLELRKKAISQKAINYIETAYNTEQFEICQIYLYLN